MIQYIQFNGEVSSREGYDPEENRFYKVESLEDTLTYDGEDDEGDYYEESEDAITIHQGSRIRYVTESEDVPKFILTVLFL